MNPQRLMTTFALLLAVVLAAMLSACLQEPQMDSAGSEVSSGSADTQPAPAQVCRCYAGSGAAVACPDCDNETIAELCHTHDAACTAANGGVQAFCSTYTPPPATTQSDPGM